MRIGIDLGGTKIELVALTNAGDELSRKRIPTPQGDYTGTLKAIVGLIEDTELRLGMCGTIGIGIPGAESLVNGRIKNANSTCLNGKPLRADLQALLQRDVRLANDANCFALSEAIDGSASGARLVFGAILGTGVGGGIVVNQQVLIGCNAIAGEWGHNPLPDFEALKQAPPACYCGRCGCIEAYLSGPALAADHLLHTGQALDAMQIDQRAALGDPDCETTLQRYEARLGRALASVINLLDPEIIVLGGGLSKMHRLYRNLPEYCGPHVFSDVFSTRILPPKHGDASGVRGAARLWD